MSLRMMPALFMPGRRLGDGIVVAGPRGLDQNQGSGSERPEKRPPVHHQGGWGDHSPVE
jgi:hypothetical protein